MSYVPHTEAEVQAMLATIGAGTVDELFADIPPAVRVARPLKLPPALTELELRRHMARLATANRSLGEFTCFVGFGAYDRFVPAVVDEVLRKPEFYTSYTPYQPEISQGNLQAMFEYQSMVAALTGMDVANASVYDGATAAAEGMLMACRATGREQVIVARTVHPHVRAVLSTYARGRGLDTVELPFTEGVSSPEELSARLSSRTACVVVQQPNALGYLENAPALAALAKQAGAWFLAVVDPVSLALLVPPGEYGADVAAGEGQSLGLRPAFGGGSVGFLATRMAHVRQLPGRLVGETVDEEGRRGYVLTLQAREQHIRRHRATSNLCTNHSLFALANAVYLAALGPQGLREVAQRSVSGAHYLEERLRQVPGFARATPHPFFHEFLVRTHLPPAQVHAALAEKGFLAGLPVESYYPELAGHLHFCVTETRTRAEMDALVEALAQIAAA